MGKSASHFFGLEGKVRVRVCWEKGQFDTEKNCHSEIIVHCILPPLFSTSKAGEFTSKVIAISRINLHPGGVLSRGCCIVIQSERDTVPSGVDGH